MTGYVKIKCELCIGNDWLFVLVSQSSWKELDGRVSTCCLGVCQFRNNVDQCRSCVHFESILEPNCSFWRAQVHREAALSRCSGCKSAPVQPRLWKYSRSKTPCKWLTPSHTVPGSGEYSKRVYIFLIFYSTRIHICVCTSERAFCTVLWLAWRWQCGSVIVTPRPPPRNT